MTKSFCIALAQLNLHVGNIAANVEKHRLAIIEAEKNGAEIIVFPELSITGYPSEDLLLRPGFIQDSDHALQELTHIVTSSYCIVGHPAIEKNNLYNACSIIHQGKIIHRYYKQCLPNYGVFDECRYFAKGNSTCIFTVKDEPIGVIICEDIWRLNPIDEVKKAGAKLLIVINASPFEIKKQEQRLSLLSKRARQNNLPIIYLNQVGGQDELVFDGGSMVINKDGECDYFAGFFNEEVPIIEWPSKPLKTKNKVMSQLERVYKALTLSIKDYVEKNNFKSVLIGVSGGIDSALTLALAVDALGSKRVKAALLPSKFTASMSLEDGETLAKNFGVDYDIIPIDSCVTSLLNALDPFFINTKQDVTEENIQARARAILLMALSNKFGHLVLTTGNRSELAVGYCTLYGDMAGGFAVLKDVPKMMVYDLAKYRNQEKLVIPKRVLERPPSAELAFDQKDEDSLPPYPILDKILYDYLNRSLSVDDIIKKGIDPTVVTKIVALIKKNEYKRRQGAIGPRINHHSFMKDWRYPITNGYDK